MTVESKVITTPTGVALYPWLSKPDTKFSAEGEYKVNLVLSADKAKPIVDTINEVFSTNVQEEMKKQKKKDLKTANPPYSDELDDAGQPTGNVIFKFKSKAMYKPAVFDAQGNAMVESNIWGGSEVKVNATVSPYFTAIVGAGVALRLRAVQVITLVEGSEGAGRFGFEETTGYVHSKPAEGAEVFEQGVVLPEVIVEATPEGKANAIASDRDVVFTGNAAKVPPVQAVPEPEVVKSPENDNSNDIADIVSKWGAK
jgi:hypothetical protein